MSLALIVSKPQLFQNPIDWCQCFIVPIIHCFKLTAWGVMSLALIVSKFQLFQNPIDWCQCFIVPIIHCFKLTAWGVMSLALIVSKFQLFQNSIDWHRCFIVPFIHCFKLTASILNYFLLCLHYFHSLSIKKPASVIKSFHCFQIPVWWYSGLCCIMTARVTFTMHVELIFFIVVEVASS